MQVCIIIIIIIMIMIMIIIIIIIIIKKAAALSRGLTHASERRVNLPVAERQTARTLTPFPTFMSLCVESGSFDIFVYQVGLSSLIHEGYLYCSNVRPDVTVMVGWALKINYLSIYCSNSVKVLPLVGPPRWPCG